MALKYDTISYVGLKDLEEADQEIIMRLAEENFPKIQRLVKNKVELIIDVKRYHKEGHTAKWSIHVKASTPGHVFDSTKAADWDLARTMHKAFDDIKKQIAHRLHSDAHYEKSFLKRHIKRIAWLGKRLLR